MHVKLTFVIFLKALELSVVTFVATERSLDDRAKVDLVVSATPAALRSLSENFNELDGLTKNVKLVLYGEDSLAIEAVTSIKAAMPKADVNKAKTEIGYAGHPELAKYS